MDGTVLFFRQKFTLEDAIGSHACSLEANMRVTKGIPLGWPLFLPVDTVNCVQTLKAQTNPMKKWDASHADTAFNRMEARAAGKGGERGGREAGDSGGSGVDGGGGGAEAAARTAASLNLPTSHASKL
jgi:uncharacterized membrane protein YgcG